MWKNLRSNKICPSFFTIFLTGFYKKGSNSLVPLVLQNRYILYINCGLRFQAGYIFLFQYHNMRKSYNGFINICHKNILMIAFKYGVKKIVTPMAYDKMFRLIFYSVRFQFEI